MKKSFLILSLLALTFISCPPPDPETQPEPEKPTLSKIDITDAAALFVEPSGTDAGKIFKIKKDLATIEEVKYTNSDGSSADMGSLKASYVINAHNDYAIIGFAADPNKAKTYDFELVADKAYLVRKSDGKVFSLDEYGYPSCDAVMASGKYIYYPVGEIKETETDKIAGETGILTTYGNKLIRIDASGTTPTGKNILPENIDSVSRFFIDKNENVWFHTPDHYSPFITENGLFGEMESGFALIHSVFGLLATSQGGFIYYDNTLTQPTDVLLSNLYDVAQDLYENENLVYGGNAKVFTTTTPLMIYESGNKSVALYKSHFIIYTKNGEDDISAALEIGNHLNAFSINESLPFTAGADTVIAFTNDSAISVNLATGNTITKNYFNTESVGSIINRNENMIMSVSDGNNGYKIMNSTIYSSTSIQIGKTSGKVKLIDMEYSVYKPLPYHSCIGY